MSECTSSVFDHLSFDPTSDVLGRGKQGTVFRAKDGAGKLFAVKVIPSPEGGDSTPMGEMTVLKRLQHPNCVNLESHHMHDNERYLVLEFCGGERLMSFVNERKLQHRFSEANARAVVRQILLALHHIHSRNCVHGDLKPDNILVDESDDTLLVKLVDFGLSSFLDDPMDSGADAAVECPATGTALFMAPESLKSLVQDSGPLWGSRQSIQKTDIFSLGVIVFMMLSGQHPFGGSQADMRRLLTAMTDRLYFPKCFWEGVSDKAQKFVRRLLQPNSVNRPTAAEALGDEWFT